MKLLVSEHTRIEEDGRNFRLRDYLSTDLQVKSAKFIDQRSFGGLTALHFAVVSQNLDCVQILLENGAASMVKTDGEAFIGDSYLTPGSSPLHVAALVGSLPIAHAILQNHAELMSAAGPATGERRRRPWEGHSRTDIRSMRNSHRRLPFHIARERGRRFLQHLLDPRVNVDVALDQARDAQQGLGTKRLSNICALVIQNYLLKWLDDYERQKDEENGKHEDATELMSDADLGGSRQPEPDLANAQKNTTTNSSSSGSLRSWLGTLYSKKDGKEPSTHSDSPRHARHATADDVNFDIQVQEAQARMHRVHSESCLTIEKRKRPNRVAFPDNAVSIGSLCGVAHRLDSGDFEEDAKNEFLEHEYSEKKCIDSDSMHECSTNSEVCEEPPTYTRECGICLDSIVEVAFKGCGHELCIDCARNLTLQEKRPPQCPFCRQLVTHFTAVTDIN